jgi:hypothetical protein
MVSDFGARVESRALLLLEWMIVPFPFLLGWFWCEVVVVNKCFLLQTRLFKAHLNINTMYSSATTSLHSTLQILPTHHSACIHRSS